MYTLWIANKRYSSWSFRPWLLLKELKIPFEEKIIFFEDGKSSYNKFKQFTPTGLVPCLTDGTLSIWDSLAICEYIAENHPQAWPTDKYARAWARSATAEMHSGFIALRQYCPFNCEPQLPTPEITEDLRKDLARLDTLWSEGLSLFSGPWLAGNAFTIVDAFYAPVILRMKTYGFTFNHQIEAWITAILSLENVTSWLAAAQLEPEISH